MKINAIGWLGGAVIATSIIQGKEFLLDYQSQEYPWAKGPSNKIWMILGPSKKKWMILWDDLWAKQQTEYG